MIVEKRSCGILFHITSLPSPYGIGDLGPEAYKFADLLAEAGQRYWQILPLNPTESGMGNSPYSSHSAFAGNPLLLSPDLLLQDGLLDKNDLRTDRKFNDQKVDFERVTEFKQQIWNKAFASFKRNPDKELQNGFDRFKQKHSTWLNDFSQFVVFKEYFGQKAWPEWEEGIKNRNQKFVQQLAKRLAEEIEREQFLQFLFYRQWEKLKNYCHGKEITFIGDLPFYISHDSADVWANPKYFKLDKKGKPTAVSGVPPDFFSDDGQLWGTPVFNWKELEKNNYEWWLLRIRYNLTLFGLLRLDHFRAFSAYWEVPAGEKTARNGKWVKSPGEAIFSLVREQFPQMPVIAEDLGEIDQPVRDLQQQFNLPGMRLLLFAFGDDLAFESSFLPHNHIRNCVVYTGTHDNVPARAWLESVKPADKKRLKEYSKQEINKENIHLVLTTMAYQSVAQLAVIPMQDILGLGKEAIMNQPGTGKNNWEWRLPQGAFSKKVAKEVRALACLYGRAD